MVFLAFFFLPDILSTSSKPFWEPGRKIFVELKGGVLFIYFILVLPSLRFVLSFNWFGCSCISNLPSHSTVALKMNHAIFLLQRCFITFAASEVLVIFILINCIFVIYNDKLFHVTRIVFFFSHFFKSMLGYLSFSCLSPSPVARGLRPANGILQRPWTLQHSRMQWSRFIWIMLVIW